MYSMPIVGTSARLYFPNEASKNPIVTGCVRTNGSSCAKTSDTKNRYFGTEHGSEVEMTPSALNIKGGSSSPLSISIDDNIGITITSNKKLNLSADSEIIMKTPKNVKINGVSQINAQKTNTESGFSLETDLHFLSNNVIKNGSSNESYPDFDDEPQEGKMPEPKKEDKNRFSWGKLARNVLAGLAVAAVGSMAYSDIKRREVSDITDYMGTAARESFVGALSGAVFGPFEAVGLGGKMALGGISNAFESVARQKLNREDVNWWTVAQDAGIGAAIGGLFHFGGKAINGASPYVKKATNKISSTLSENAKFAKMALANMEKRPKSVVLGSNFGNVSKKIDDFVDEFKDVKNATKGVGNRNALLRGDSALYSDTRPNGIRKSYISSEGSLVPANIDGLHKGRQVTVTEHILGGYRKGAKGNSPYTSFTFNSDIVTGYGDNLIEIDISGLRKAIQSGDVTDVAILSPKQIERLIKNDKIQSDFWKKRALNCTKRDSEYLIRGEIPSQFIKINK